MLISKVIGLLLFVTFYYEIHFQAVQKRERSPPLPSDTFSAVFVFWLPVFPSLLALLKVLVLGCGGLRVWHRSGLGGVDQWSWWWIGLLLPTICLRS